MPTALAVAEYILTLSDPDIGDIISNLKMQKLLYYCQCACLAIHDRPLFDEVIENWPHGPTVPAVYQAYAVYNNEALPLPTDYDFDQLTDDEVSVINEIYNVYGQFAAWRLQAMTKQEPPWLDTEPGEGISHSRLKRYFKTQLIE